LPNFRPKQELILIKTKHPRLEVAKIVAGMSGSPIYIDGKMIGAYAYGWTCGAEPVAGVTPIKNMLQDLVRPLPDSIYGWPLKVLPGKRNGKGEAAPDSGERDPRFGSMPGRYEGALAAYDVRRHAEALATRRQSS